MSNGSDPQFEALVRAVVEAAQPRLLHAATAAVSAALDRAPQWRLIPATIDPDSIQGPYVEVYPDDNPDEGVQVVRLDPRQGVPSSNDGERNRVLILSTPPAGGYLLGVIPDDPEADNVTVQPEAYRTLVATTGPLTGSATALTATGDTDMQLLDVSTVPGRDYLFHLKTEATHTNAAQLWTLNLEVDGSLVDRFWRTPRIDVPGGVCTYTVDNWCAWSAPDAGPHDFIVNAVEHVAGSLQLVASATVLRYFTMWGKN